MLEGWHVSMGCMFSKESRNGVTKWWRTKPSKPHTHGAVKWGDELAFEITDSKITDTDDGCTFEADCLVVMKGDYRYRVKLVATLTTTEELDSRLEGSWEGPFASP